MEFGEEVVGFVGHLDRRVFLQFQVGGRVREEGQALLYVVFGVLDYSLSACLIVLDLSPLRAKRVLLWAVDMLSHLVWASSWLGSSVFCSLSLMADKCSSTSEGRFLAPGVWMSLLYTVKHCWWYFS